mmetsp:Transcript_34490/g.53851  ORF Transcript_34490/g.53851 Transcript_34490/m.53851 type:complete len:280 (+) Transcript_34490:901-1740(+)
MRIEWGGPAWGVREVGVAVPLGNGNYLIVVEDEGGIPVGGPFEEDQDAQVSEDGIDENHLRDVHEVEREVILPVQAVHKLAAHSGNHLHDTSDDSELHLEGVGRVELVGGVSPPRISAERVNLPINLPASCLTLVEVPGVADVGPQPLLHAPLDVYANAADALRVLRLTRAPGGLAPELQRHSEELIIDETRIGRKDTHKENIVASLINGAEHLIRSQTDKGFFVDDEEGTSEGHHETMTNVTEHNSEEERESDHTENSGIELLVAGSAVSIHNGLCTL